jgi:hypothetical protein
MVSMDTNITHNSFHGNQKIARDEAMLCDHGFRVNMLNFE